MTNQEFKAGRAQAGLTQIQAARRLRLSQPYLSQLESNERPVTPELATLATKVYGLSPTGLPIRESVTFGENSDATRLARQLSGLGYPGFAHLRREQVNPAALVFDAIVQRDLEVRLTEALPWVLGTYPDLNWSWLMDQARLRDVQNRLGFLVGMATELGAARGNFSSALATLSTVGQKLEHSRLVREDTLCRESMPLAERRWLDSNRSPLARHWNLLTGLTLDQLSYAT
jgi:transcriptional regulator with XRE-family HTH domain